MGARQESSTSATDGLSGQWISLEELTALEFFRSTKRPFRIKLNGNFAPRPGSDEPGIKAAVRREYAAGETICEAGSYGATAFLLVEGTATSFVPERATAARIAGRKPRSLRTLLRTFRRRARSARAPEPTETSVGEVSAYGTFVRTRPPPQVLLRAGDVFGVDACINFYPRGTTVRAEERCVVIEMMRSVLDTVRDAGTAGPEVTARYRASAIRHELSACPLLQDVLDGDLERLATGACLLTPDSAEIHDGRLYREGDRADAVYLVRSGTIKLAHETTGGEIVLTYVGRGGVLGLEPLLEPTPIGAPLVRCVSHPELATVPLDKPLTIGRGETCDIALPADDRGIGRRHCKIEQRDGSLYAVDLQSANFTLVNGERIQEAKLHVGDRISIVQYTFEIVAPATGEAAAVVRCATASGLDEFEVVALPAATLQALASSAQPMVASRAHGSVLEVAPRAAAPDGAILDDVISLNLYNSQNVLLIDLERCTRCDECVRACATAHDGVARFTRDGPRFGNYLVTMACRSCTDPKCMVGCPVSSIRRRDSLEIHIEDWCIGCQRCANQCPFGNINMVELAAKPDLAPPISADVKLRATVCDLCAGYDSPNCVYACPHDAAIRVNPTAFLSAEDQR